jgi:hypothetical protein
VAFIIKNYERKGSAHQKLFVGASFKLDAKPK